MNIIERFKAFFTPQIFSIQPMAGFASAVDPRFVNNVPPLYAAQGTESLFREMFAGNATIYTVVSKAAKKFGHIPWGVYKVEDKKAWNRYESIQKQRGNVLHANRWRTKAYNNGATQSEGALSALIARPNPAQGQDSFFESIMVSYMVAGEAFIWLNRGQVDENLSDLEVRKLPVLEMYVLPPQFMEVVPDKNDPWTINGYYLDAISGNSSRQYIRKVDVIHWKKVNPVFDPSPSRAHLRGLSPLRAGYKLLQQDVDSTDASVAMFQNGGAKAVIYNKDLKTMTPEQRTQLDEVVNRKINNSSMKAAVATMQGDWGMLDLGMSAVDMQLGLVSEKTFARICNLLDVPPALFMVDQTYENRKFAIKDWLTNSMIPACCSFRDELNRSILMAFNVPGMIIDIDASDIPELQEDMGEMVKWLALMPWLTPNEKRQFIGEEPLPDPDMDKIYAPSGVTALEDMAMPDVSASVTPIDQLQNEYNQTVNEPA